MMFSAHHSFDIKSDCKFVVLTADYRCENLKKSSKVGMIKTSGNCKPFFHRITEAGKNF